MVSPMTLSVSGKHKIKFYGKPSFCLNLPLPTSILLHRFIINEQLSVSRARFPHVTNNSINYRQLCRVWVVVYVNLNVCKCTHNAEPSIT